MVVTNNRRGGVFRGVGHESHLKSGYCCTCSVSCEACPPLVQVILAVVFPVACN